MKIPLLLDSWVLNTYSSPAAKARLSDFIADQGFLPVINALTLVEIFNPGWQNAQSAERGDLAAGLLADLGAAIVDPMTVVRSEFFQYPSPLVSLPLQLNLTEIAAPLRKEVLLRFLRADPLYLQQGKDIRRWAEGYAEVKHNWANDRLAILARAVRENQIVVDGEGYRFASPESRIEFLQSLDQRLFGWLSAEERSSLGLHIVPLFLGETAKLPAVRMSSLLFAHCYVDVPRSDRTRQLPSDLGDHWHLMVAPYCGAVTADRSMKRILERLRSESSLRCVVYDPAALKEKLG